MNEIIDGGRIKGGFLISHMKWAKQQSHFDITQKMNGHLSAETLAILDSVILATAWYPFKTLIEIDRTIAQATGGDDSATLFELGRFAAQVTLNGMQKVVAASDPHKILRKQVWLHKQLVEFGNSEYIEIAPQIGRLVRSAYPWYSPVFCQGLLGYYSEAVTMAGGARVQIKETECICAGSEQCVFEISWRA